MAGKHPVIHFELMGEDVDALHKFYEGIFGWTIKSWQTPDQENPIDYRMVTPVEGEGTAAEIGIAGAVTTKFNPDVDGPVLYVQVDDIDVAIREVDERGGTILGEKIAVPGVGWSAFFRDPGGNSMGLFQSE